MLIVVTGVLIPVLVPFEIALGVGLWMIRRRCKRRPV